MSETINVKRADEVRPSNVVDINGTRWMVTRRETVGIITTLTLSNVNHVLDIRTVGIPAHFLVDVVNA